MDLWGNETAQYNGRRFQRISESLNSQRFRVKVVTRLYSLPPLTSVPFPKLCAFPSPQNRLVSLSVSHFTRRFPGCAQGLRGNATCSATVLKDLLPVGCHIRLYSLDILHDFGKFHRLTTALPIRSTWAGSKT